MRNHLSLISILASSALLAVPIHAEDNLQADSSEANVFNADMSNPDFAAVITSFQDVCLPFIMHTTELPQSLNMQHYGTLLSEQGYEFQSRDHQIGRLLFMPATENYKPSPEDIEFANTLKRLNPTNHKNRTYGKFQVGGGSEYTKPTQSHQDGIWGKTRRPAEYKSYKKDIDSFVLREDPRQTALLQWNYASQNHPAKSCGIKLDQTSISPESFEAGFIEKDADWLKDSKQEGRWTQCTIDGADEFEFSAERKDGVLSLSVRRNDFYEPKLCGT